jgi:hypothetical protein
MAFQAKFPGVCTACRGRIQAGETIHWERQASGKGASWHLDCAPAQASRVVAPPRAQQLQLTSVSQWQRHSAGLSRPTCSGCPDGCWGCDSAEGAMNGWN